MSMRAKPPEHLTIIVPCFNEAANVRATCEEICALEPGLDVKLSIVGVDDGSTDGTSEVLEQLVAERPDTIRRIRHERNMGIGFAVLSVVNSLPPETWVSVLPGDNELDPTSILPFLAMRDRYDLILGYIQNPLIRGLERRLGSYSFTRTVCTLYGFEYRYLNGLKLYRARVFQGIEVVSKGHAFVAELLAKAVLREPSIRVGEAPFVMRGRISGESKAFQPMSMLRAVKEVVSGYNSVRAFREYVIHHPKRGPR